MENNLVIAKIVKPQGIAGELKILPLTDDSADLKKIKTVAVGGSEYKVLSLRITPSGVFICLSGVGDRNKAEGLRGKDILCRRSEFEIPEGRYFIADIIGCFCVTEQGTGLGRITDIRKSSTDIYTLQNEDKLIYFPAAEGVIESICPEQGKVTVNEKRFKEVALYED